MQQCADVILRLRADYLWEQKKHDEIEFHFTSGDLYRWKDYKKGIRAQIINGNKVSFKKLADYNNSYENFQRYMEQVYMYAGTISLHGETLKLTNKDEIRTGDIIVTPGSPGHAVIIVGTAENNRGEKVHLIAQGYTPAQSIHILKNKTNSRLSPWYKLNTTDKDKTTARYVFKPANYRRFK